MRRGLSRRLSIAVAALRENRRAGRFWATRPHNAFTREGFELFPGFLDRAECRRLVALADELAPGPSHRIAGNCYTWVKSETGSGRNTRVREILNVNDVDDGIARLLESRRIQRLYEERLGERVELYGFSLQIDQVDTRTKRDFHVDTLFPPLLKAFVYLTDVAEDGDGPYTIVPGSHRHFGRKAIADLVNAATSAASRDMHLVTADRYARRLLGAAGTMILSTQDAMHKGWNDHSRRPRYALIAQGTTATHYDGRPLRDGSELLAPPR
jgi:hypothetical protein